MKVKLWCAITHGADSFGVLGTLLTREVEMGALPNGDEMSCIDLWRETEEGAGSYSASVKRRYWDFDGIANLELVQMHVDPVGPLRDHWRGSPESTFSMQWDTSVDPDPMPLMLASGWTEYNP
ncbi:MAG TPA: hypothetical protein VGS97_20005 [Actinocrinis sp.]|uniref:hypothetical protein n=1 Tax=Actinocrinis sp. TaxID=1920516 RepID=UPI002DDD2839|nr:hypothetical protein [Actinocrinis sp.]HEV2346393.1 hypothetical protein [Actinocrinis sp.]